MTTQSFIKSETISLQSTFNEVDKLFDQVTSLSKDDKVAFLEKIRLKLEHHEITQSDTNTTSENRNKRMAQKTKRPGRKKKLTEKGKAFFFAENRSKKTDEPHDSIKPCYVKLSSIDSTSPVTSGQQEVKDKLTLPSDDFCQNDDSVLSDLDYEINVEDLDSCDEADDFEDAEFKPNVPSKKKISTGVKKSRKTAKKRKGEGTFKCSDCSFTCHLESLLKRHLCRHNKQGYVCEQCGKSFNYKAGLDVHLKRHNGVKSFECALCDFRAVCKIDIIRHMTKHTGERNYTCEFCGKPFTSDNTLRNHIKHMHKKTQDQSCNVCEFKTHSKDILRRHYLVKHTDRERFECPVCHEIVKQKGSFLVHMRKHTGEKPYYCETCTKSFKSSSQLASHKRTHRPAEHKCSSCTKMFRNKYQLDRHMIVHTGAKPYICHMCTYACNVKGNITKHIRAVHKVAWFTFKEPYPTANEQDVSPDAMERGFKATDSFLKEHTQKTGEILTLDDLKRQSNENQQLQQEAKLEELKNKKAKKKNDGSDLSEATSLFYPEDCVVNGDVDLQGCKVGSDVTIPAVSGEMCSADILSDAVQMLGTPVQDVTDVCDSRNECVSEAMSIPFEIGSNMYIIQVVPDDNISY